MVSNESRQRARVLHTAPGGAALPPPMPSRNSLERRSILQDVERTADDRYDDQGVACNELGLLNNEAIVVKNQQGQ